MVRIAVLGGVAVGVDSAGLRPIRGEKPRLVLARLVIAGGRDVTVSELHEDVWQGRGNRSVVKTTMSRLRDQLGGDDPIRSDAGRYGLDLGAAELDVVEFEEHLARAREAVAIGDDETAIEALGAALARRRGPAYADCDAGFAMAEAARLESRLWAAEEQWLELRTRGGDRTAVDELAALARARPDRRELVLTTMEALHEFGRTRDAVAIARAHAVALAENWGLLPAPEVVAFERRLLTNDPLLRRPVGAGRVDPCTGGLPFVGRAAEVGRLVEHLASVDRSRSPLLVAGAPGKGKSALLRHAAERTDAVGLPLVFIGCAHRPDTALEPMVRLVETTTARLDDDELRRVHALAGVPLRHLVPALDDRLPPAEPTEIGGRGELVDRIIAFLVAAVPRGALIVDDLQWADDVSLEILARVQASPDGPRVAGATRSADLTRVVAAFDRFDGADVLSLEGLHVEEIADFLDGLTHDDEPEPDGDLLARLAERTGGSPLFLVSLLAGKNDIAELRDDLDAGTVPETAMDAVERRIDAVGTDVVEMLEAAAVVGSPFPLAVVTDLVGAPPATIERAVAAGIIVVDDDMGRFAQNLLADAVVARLAPGRRVQLHDRATEILARLEAPPVQVAVHAFGAAELDPRRAVDWLALAAAEQRAAFDFSAAGRLLDDALDVLAGIGASGSGFEAEILIERGMVAILAGEDDHVELLRRAANQAADDAVFVRAVTALCDFTSTTNGLVSDEEAGRLLDDALTRSVDPRLRCRLEIAAGVFYALSHDHDQARTHYDCAWEHIHEVGDDNLLDAYLYDAGVVLSGPDDLPERQRAAELLRERAPQSVRLGFASAYLSWTAAMVIGDGDGVDEAFATRPPVEILADDPGVVFGAMFADAARAYLRGHLDESEVHLSHALERGLGWSTPGPVMASFGAVLFGLRDAQGRLAEVAEMYEGSYADLPDHPMLQGHVAACRLSTGDSAGVRSILDPLTAVGFTSLPRDVTWTAALVMFARAAHALDDRDAAAAIRDLLAPFSGQMSTIGVATYGPIDTALAQCAAVLQDAEAVAHHVAAAVEITNRLRAPLMTAEARALTDVDLRVGS